MRGQVQGVGLRPYVYRLATERGLSGWVRNGGAGVEIEVQGPAAALQDLLLHLRRAPSPARIDAVEQCPLVPALRAESFVIAASEGAGARDAAPLAPDIALCPGCLEELLAAGGRRRGYAFIACARCGPRFTLGRRLPFDRAATAMAAFEPCAACRREYADPTDRRFHAQIIACPDCGPRLSVHDGDGKPMAEADPIAATVALLRAGRIVAVKGVGGFHLVCDARNAAAVEVLRRRKHREAKPFAVMAANAASVAPWAQCGDGPRRLLESPERPIVLLDKRTGCDDELIGVAPDVAQLGVMLPYAPLHYLLFHHAAGAPDGPGWPVQPQPLLLVCTSANHGGDPLVTDLAQAVQGLRGIADAFLNHDRVILQRCDDSVLRPTNGTPLVIRRARGWVPRPVRLSRSGPPLLALGGDLKNSFCLTRGDEAYVSQHIGDLDSGAARRALEETVHQWLSALDIMPRAVVHDRHPDFFTTRFGQHYAAQHDLPCIAVQHHHAHIAAVAAERGVDGPVLGVALDGFGLGDDGGLWGGELLRVEGHRYRRLGHLQPLALPGGERGAREPWRMAASALHALGREHEIRRRWSRPGVDTVVEMLNKQWNAPFTSSAGRWFDAAAGLLGVAERNGYEGHAAMKLEALALRHGPVAPSSTGYHVEPEGVLNLLPLVDRLADETDAAYGAALFHATLAAALGEWIRRAARRESLDDVVLNGGCFMNIILRRALCAELAQAGLRVHTAEQLPPNDGGLSLGQAWIGMSILNKEKG